ncbi:MAG: toxin-antitoxin system YwqK family antitoxin [Crocinitomicaceae bacterium]|nr:toxin-antitoxin system YwqK family antitoxin [Crocinitomicaceae bacterium]
MLSLIFVCSLGISFSQDYTFIKDSLLTNYLEDGHPNENFINVVGRLENDLYNGFCQVYEVLFENSFLPIGNDIEVEQGEFLIYGEGNMIDGIKDGKWTYYLIEHQSLKKFLSKESFYKKGLKEGEFRYYYPAGEIASEGNYVDNQLDGIVTNYNKYGSILSVSEYKNNLIHGSETTYYPDGVKQFEKHFTNGITDGVFKQYYPNGSIQDYQEVKMGVFHGIYRYYYDNGALWVEKEYVNGLLWNLVGNYDLNGNPYDQGTLSEGNGTENYYTTEGLLYCVRTFENGVMTNQEMK